MSEHIWVPDANGLRMDLDKETKKKKQVNMKSAGQPAQAGYSEYPKSRVLRMLTRMLTHKFLWNLNDTRASIGQIRDPWHSHAFTIAHLIIGLRYISIRLFI